MRHVLVISLIASAIAATGCTAEQPHLFVRATGEDLGASLGGGLALSEQLHGVVNFTLPVAIFFGTNSFQCMGGGSDAVMDLVGHDPRETRFVAPDGTVAVRGRQRTIDAMSRWALINGDETCEMLGALRTVTGPEYAAEAGCSSNARTYPLEELEIR